MSAFRKLIETRVSTNRCDTGRPAARLRGAPEYRAPDAMLQGIRLVIAQSAMLRQ